MGIDFPQYHPHYEELEGTMLLPRTSSILRLHRQSLHQLLNFGNCPAPFRRMVQRRAKEGVNVHAAIHDYLYRGIESGTIRHEGFDLDDMDTPERVPELTESEGQKFDRFRAWLKESKAVILRPPEERIVSPDLEFGGTTDLAVRMDKKNVVVDIKIGEKVHLTNLLQAESYGELIEEDGMKMDAVGILLLGTKNRTGFNITVDRIRHERQDEFHRLLEKWQTLFPEPFEYTQNNNSRFSDQDISVLDGLNI